MYCEYGGGSPVEYDSSSLDLACIQLLHRAKLSVTEQLEHTKVKVLCYTGTENFLVVWFDRGIKLWPDRHKGASTHLEAISLLQLLCVCDIIDHV